MPTPTYTPILSTTLGSNQASTTFSNLNTAAAGMRDLILICNIIPVNGSNLQRHFFTFNGSSTGYNNIFLEANGSSASTYGFNGGYFTTSDNNTFNNSTPVLVAFQALDFSQTDRHKTVLIRGNQSDTRTTMVAGRWADTSAVTSLTITASTGQLGTGSTFNIYGVIA